MGGEADDDITQRTCDIVAKGRQRLGGLRAQLGGGNVT